MDLGLSLIAAATHALIFAQAEPAPGPALPAPGVQATKPPPPPPPHAIGFSFGFSRRMSAAASAVPPANGFAVQSSFTLGHFSLPFGPQLSWSFQFAYHRHTKTVLLSRSIGGQTETFDGTRNVSHYDFAFSPVFAVPIGRFVPFIAGGAGVGFGYFFTAEDDYAPGRLRTLRPVGRAAIGLDVDVKDNVRLGVEANYTYPFRTPMLKTSDGNALPVFGARSAFSVWLKQLF